MFIVKNDDGKNDYRSYKSIYFNYFLISYYRVRLFLAMQVRVMAACMESQSFIRSAQSRSRDGTCVSDVCGLMASKRRKISVCKRGLPNNQDIKELVGRLETKT